MYVNVLRPQNPWYVFKMTKNPGISWILGFVSVFFFRCIVASNGHCFYSSVPVNMCDLFKQINVA